VKYLKEKHAYGITPKTLSNKISMGEGPEVEYKFGRPTFRIEALDRWVSANSEIKRAYTK
jgi:hypothetical protein